MSWLESLLDQYKPWLWFPPIYGHQLMNPSLKALCFLDESLSEIDSPESHWNEVTWKNLRFRNPLGIAGGVDKTAESVNSWWSLGAGFIEVGTVTPQFQQQNSGPVIARDVENLALWNRMGFPHPGYKETLNNLENIFSNRPTPIFINLGKNRWVSNEQAASDYLFLMNQLHGLADAFVINISSPNTVGLRELLKREYLFPFLSPLSVQSKKLNKPILLKISPDESLDSLERIVGVGEELEFDGYIVANTSTYRPEKSSFPKEGGLSGKPLAPLSKKALEHLIKCVGSQRPKRLIINAGGVFSAADVKERLEIGADLVQIYSSIVFNGPYIFKKIAREYFLK